MVPLLPDALEFSFTLLPLQKRSGLNNMCNVYSPKNLWNNVCLLFCVPVVTSWCFFNVFTAFCCFWYDFFITFSPHFYEQIKHKAGNRFYRPISNDKPIKTLKTKETQRIGQLLGSESFWEVYTHWLQESTVRDQLFLIWNYMTHNINIKNVDWMTSALILF